MLLYNICLVLSEKRPILLSSDGYNTHLRSTIIPSDINKIAEPISVTTIKPVTSFTSSHVDNKITEIAVETSENYPNAKVLEEGDQQNVVTLERPQSRKLYLGHQLSLSPYLSPSPSLSISLCVFLATL